MSRLDEIEKRAQAVPPGPWALESGRYASTYLGANGVPAIDATTTSDDDAYVCFGSHAHANEEAVEAFVLNARTDIDWLIARVRELERHIRSAEQLCGTPDCYHVEGVGHRLGCPRYHEDNDS
jgi:hypothetical protein